MIKSIWGNNNFDWEFAKSDGSSGGIITIWNSLIFQKISPWSVKEMLVVNGFLIEDGKGCMIINVYTPNISSLRWVLWDQIGTLVGQCRDDYLCIAGDFNSIRAESERVGRSESWDGNDISRFNNFIEFNNLVDLNLVGRMFTWYRPDGSCESKLD